MFDAETLSLLTILVPVALFASMLSGAIGMGGGVTLLAAMAFVMPPATVVPVHGLVQLTSNTTRALALWKRVRWRFVAFYVPAMVVGVFVGLQFYRGGQLSWFRPLIGAFVLAFLLWERFKPRRLRIPDPILVPAGFVGGLLTILVGASGPYLAAFFLRDDMEREEIVATKASVQLFGHFLKIPAFLSIRFDYVEHLDLALPLVVCAIGGTFLGTWGLRKMGERVFRWVFRIVLALLALRLLLDPLL